MERNGRHEGQAHPLLLRRGLSSRLESDYGTTATGQTRDSESLTECGLSGPDRVSLPPPAPPDRQVAHPEMHPGSTRCQTVSCKLSEAGRQKTPAHLAQAAQPSARLPSMSPRLSLLRPAFGNVAVIGVAQKSFLLQQGRLRYVCTHD